MGLTAAIGLKSSPRRSCVARLGRRPRRSSAAARWTRSQATCAPSSRKSSSSTRNSRRFSSATGKSLSAKVLDRTALILKSLGERARTREGAFKSSSRTSPISEAASGAADPLERQRGGFWLPRRSWRNSNRDRPPSPRSASASPRSVTSLLAGQNVRVVCSVRPCKRVPFR